MTEIRFVDLAGAEPDEAVVVIDVLRAFTVQPLMIERGIARLLAVADEDVAWRLRRERWPDALLAGEEGGEQLQGFDLGNSPTQVAATDVGGRTVVHRTSAGTQGLLRTAGSGTVFAAAFVTAAATTAALRALAPGRITFVVTGASRGRDGDEDLAAAELIAARLRGEDPDPAPYLARVATSDAGASFVPGGPGWAPPSDLDAALEVDRHELVVTAGPGPDDDVLELTWRQTAQR